MQSNNSIQLTEANLTLEDKKELKRQNVIFFGGVTLLSIVASIIIFLLVYSLLWRIVIGVAFLSLIGIFASSVYSNFVDLRFGKKVVKTGEVWDTYEEFQTQKQGDKVIGKRKFFFRLGDLKHRFFQYSFESEADAKTPQEAAEFEVGQTVEVHFTKSGYQLREVIVKAADRSNASNLNVIHKIKSKRQITQNKPRKWNEKIADDFYYLQVQDVLFAVDEEVFNKVPTGALAEASSDTLSKKNKNIKLQTSDGNWLDIDMTKIQMV